jgi:hypothetical protein
MGRHLDMVDAYIAVQKRGSATEEKSVRGDQRGGWSLPSRSFCRNPELQRVLDILDTRCPAHVELDRWRQAVEDGRRFLATWGEQVNALGWTPRDLFGLHTPPASLHPSYRRLSRYDAIGLIWLLDGREVIVLTENTAAIRWPGGGSVTVYRKHNKPALGPLGDSLDDLTGA